MKPVRLRGIRILWGGAVLGLALLACNLPFQSQDQPPTLTPQLATEAVPPTSPAAPPTQAGETAPPPEPTAPPPDVVFEGVSFSFDKSLARRVLPEIAPPEELLWGDPVPEHIRFSFDGYLLKDTFHKPALIIYPAGEYSNNSEAAADVIDALERYLAEKPAEIDAIPFLPFWNAAQVMHTQVQFTDFQNGKGVRFLTQYGQDVSPINNQSIFYTYQGISDDGAWYVAAVLPVNHPLLPATSEISSADYTSFADNYLPYIAETTQKLDGQPPSSFNPNLELLDAMIGSLLIAP